MACDAQSLATDAACIQTCIPEGMRMAVLIYLAAQVAGVDPTAQSLVNSATCIQTCVPPGMRLAVLVSLACQIS